MLAGLWALTGRIGQDHCFYAEKAADTGGEGDGLEGVAFVETGKRRIRESGILGGLFWAKSRSDCY